MNNRARQDLNEQDRVNLPNGDYIKTPRFTNITRFKSVGFSPIFVCKSKVDGRNGIVAGDTVYFKANNKRGVNKYNRTEESLGSCEDVAEVFGYYLLSGYKNKLGDKAILMPTVYDFAEYSNDEFWKFIAEQTDKVVESSRLYGCVSKNCLADDETIVQGHLILSELCGPKQCSRSSNNTLSNYEKSFVIMAENLAKNGQELVIDPICTRYLANVIYWDYLYSNSDRHCRNITFKTRPLGNGKLVITPTSILDNGGGLALQSPNCEKTYTQQLQSIKDNGKVVETIGGVRTSFDPQLDFFVGKDSFKNPEIAGEYDNMSYELQLVMMMSQNRILYEDFKNIANAIDVPAAFQRMCKETRFRADFLPEFETIATEVVKYKRKKISRVMAIMLGEEFDEAAFNADQSLYINKFESLVLDNELSLFIANDSQIKEFKNWQAEMLAKKQKD